MKLTPKQIDRLYQFTRQHYVEYYDLQTELVDHLANAIEEQWAENPKISFEDALQKEFKKFGVFGFMNVVEERQRALNKKYGKIVLQHLKIFFTLPKVIGTFSAIGIVFFVLKQSRGVEGIIATIMISLIILFFVGIGFLARKRKRELRETGKKWLLKEIIFGYSSMSGYAYFLIQIIIRLTGRFYADWVLLFSSVIIVSFVLTGYIILFLIPSKAEEYLKQTYPEYEISK